MSPPARVPGVEIGLCDGAGELDAIIALQRANLEETVGAATAARDGFVTLVHRREILAAFHAMTPALVARAAGRVVAYALAMDLSMRPLVPALEPFFDLLPGIRFHDRPLVDHRVYVMGQICVESEFRGRGVFDALYAGHVAHYAGHYELVTTEVALRNVRSLRAHLRLGFTSVHTYRDDTDHWSVLALALCRAAAPGSPTRVSEPDRTS